MIEFKREAFYHVYPSWADYPLKWEDIPRVFSNPFESGYLTNESRWTRIGYKPGVDRFELIRGPLRNGIIKDLRGNSSDRYFWIGVLLKHADFSGLPGFHYTAPHYNVSWLEEKSTDEHFLNLKKKAETFLPQISLDYEGFDDSIFFISLSFGTKSPDEELCMRFKMLWQGFGMNCREVATSDKLPAVAEKLISPEIWHRWFIVERGTDDAGLIAAKSFYLGCAAKQISRRLKNIHLIGAFEEKPVMAPLWNVYSRPT